MSTITCKGLSLIWAMDRNRTIGKDNRLPWRLPDELAYFKKVTMGHPIIMGRRTYESIGRPLPGRTNVVLSRDENYQVDGCTIAHSVQEIMDKYEGSPYFVIGGAQIYRQFLPYAERLYVTFIDHDFKGDEWFPEINWPQWQLIAEQPGEINEKNPYTYYFRIYERL
jgi:dihydrofolate reductase